MKPSTWLTVDPAALKHRIAIQSQSGTQDSFGQPVATWNTVRATNGGLNLVSMKEAFGEGQLTSQETDIWTVRWSAGIQAGMRILFAGNLWKIQAVNDVQRRNIVLHLLGLQLNAGS